METDAEANGGLGEQMEEVIRCMRLALRPPEAEAQASTCKMELSKEQEIGEGNKAGNQAKNSKGPTLKDLHKQLELLQQSLTVKRKPLSQAKIFKNKNKRPFKGPPRSLPALFRSMGTEIAKHVSQTDPSFFEKISKLAKGNVQEIKACAYWNGGNCTPKDKWGRHIVCPFMHVCAICAHLKMVNTHKADECHLKIDFDQFQANGPFCEPEPNLVPVPLDPLSLHEAIATIYIPESVMIDVPSTSARRPAPSSPPPSPPSPPLLPRPPRPSPPPNSNPVKGKGSRKGKAKVYYLIIQTILIKPCTCTSKNSRVVARRTSVPSNI
jgi:hypothetical protein